LPLQLRQVLTNLLSNAVKFTPRGRILVTATSLGRSGDMVRLGLEVQDTGVGIPPAACERIFETFAQADETVARRFGGSGLGLAIAKQLVELMGGAISLESEVGRGSTFMVFLPLQHDPAGLVRAPELSGRRLLLVTPDNDLAATLQAHIRAWHGDMRWHAEGEAALEALGAEHDGTRPVLLLDGRDNPLAALSLAHRAANAAPRPALVLFIATPAGRDAIAGVADGQLAAVIEAPVAEATLASALLGMLADVPAGAEGEPLGVAVPAMPRPGTVAAARPLKMLVADDNAANGKVLKNVLEAAGHMVEVVADGEAALAALERGHVELALLDINMPEVSGYEVTKLYRMGHVGEARLPIVALTADATSETERLCREAGMDAVLTKPVEPAQLIAAIDEIYARTAPPERLTAAAPPVVTPISAHPRFVSDPGVVVDEGTVDALRTLGGNDFMLDVIETFRKDAWQLLDQFGTAVEKADLRAFRECVHSLKSGAANIGAVRFCQTLAALRDLGVKDLRQAGAGYLERIGSELARLDATLEQMTREQRRG
jgi:two-component system sensor histidine kinase RpfC